MFLCYYRRSKSILIQLHVDNTAILLSQGKGDPLSLPGDEPDLAGEEKKERGREGVATDGGRGVKTVSNKTGNTPRSAIMSHMYIYSN